MGVGLEMTADGSTVVWSMVIVDRDDGVMVGIVVVVEAGVEVVEMLVGLAVVDDGRQWWSWLDRDVDIK